MCIAILNRTGVISAKTFKKCWNSNPDGGGFTYFDGQKAIIVKEMKSHKLLHAKYLEARAQYPDSDFAIHFRISTHGKINETNCHPFRINKRSAFIHNGMINNMERSPEFSDTYLFNQFVLKTLPQHFAKNEAICELIGAYIGHSKLVIIDGQDSYIINEYLGHWNAGNWYSNDSYKDAPKVVKNAYNWTKVTAPKTDSKKFKDIDWTKFDYSDHLNDYSEELTKEVDFCCESCLGVGPTQFNCDYEMHLCARCTADANDY
jgi:predicted glutamine amidotransferase